MTEDNEIEGLKDRITRLEQYIHRLTMQLEGVISQLNRVDNMQLRIDATLRNHRHPPEVGGHGTE